MKSVVISAAVIAAAAVLLACAGLGLSGVSEENSRREFQEMLSSVLPGNTSFTKEDYQGDEEVIRSVYRGENGFVVETAADGYAGDISMLVGVSPDGTVMGLVIRELSETYGLGANALNDTEFLSQFLGTSGDAEVGKTIDGITGATVSSKAIAKAVNAAAAYVTGADITSGATEWGG